MAGRQDELPLDLEIFLCFAIYSASHAFSRIYQALLEGLGQTYPQYHCDGCCGSVTAKPLAS